MVNQSHSSGNPNLPPHVAAAKKIKRGLPKAEDELEKTEVEKEQDTSPENNKPFNLDKVDDLIKAKEEKAVNEDSKEKKKKRRNIIRKKDN